jgi:hypothetical protein
MMFTMLMSSAGVRVNWFTVCLIVLVLAMILLVVLAMVMALSTRIAHNANRDLERIRVP